MNATEKMLVDGFNSNTLKLPTIHLMQMGTGKGKTYFVVHTLIPRALANGERVLVLGNRRALHLQTVQAIRKAHDDFVNVTSPMVRGYWGRGALPPVVVKTYQEVEMMISNGEDFFAVWGRFDYIVMDECHYFMQDSMFNPYTALSFEAILSQRCQLYCMSATMEEFEKVLDQRLQYLHEKSANVLDAFLHIEKHVLEDDFSNVQAICFYENSEIVNKINASPSSEKWLVFVEDKELAKELAQKIKKL